MRDSKDLLYDLLDSVNNNFSKEDIKLLEKDELSDEEIKKIMSKNDLMKLFY